MANLRAFVLLLPFIVLASGCGDSGGDGPVGGGTTSATTTTTANSALRISWDAPVTRSDGSCLGSGLNGFVVSYGNESGNYTESSQIQLDAGDITCQQIDYDNTCAVNVVRCTATVEDLSPGDWYFAVQAFDTQGNVSNYSFEASTQVN